MIKVSIIIPVYNTAQYLKGCLDSVLAQTLNDIEVICIDDNSTDKSKDILKEYQKKDFRVNVIFNEYNIGAASSRNKGLELARGEYIQFLDSDDWLDENALELLYNKAKNNSADLCYLKFVIENECEQKYIQEGISGDYTGVITGYKCLELFRKNNEFFLYLCSVFYSNSFLHKNSLSFKKMVVGEGGQFIISALHKADRVVFLNQPVYHYRLHGESIMHNSVVNCNLVRGWISQYITLLNCLLQCNGSGDEYSMLAKRIYNDISRNVRVMDIHELNKVFDMLDKDIERYFFKLICGESSEFMMKLSSDDLDRIRNSRHVIIYGAGVYTFDVIRQLNENDIEILGVAVTNRNNGKKSYYGHHVFEIDKLINYKESSIVIVTASVRYNVEIEQTLKKLGFSNYVFPHVNS